MLYVGLDLGKQHDYTALTVAQRADDAVHIVHLHRYPLKTDYTAIATDLATTLQRPPFTTGCILGVDATGLGGPFLDLLRGQAERLPVIGITITGDRAAKWTSGRDVRVPKSELARTMARLVEAAQLRVAGGLSLAGQLMAEMRRFQAQIDRNGHVRYAADFGAGQNDDLVLSAMYSVWLAKNVHRRVQPVH
jgi:hypothetical protein